MRRHRRSSRRSRSRCGSRTHRERLDLRQPTRDLLRRPVAIITLRTGCEQHLVLDDLGAVATEGPTGHLCCEVARQEDHHRRDILRLLVVGDDVDVFRHPGLGDGRDAVRTHARPAQLHRNHVGEGPDARLRRSIVRLPVVALQAGNRGGVDDAAAAALHERRQAGPRHQHRAREVHRNDRVPLVARHLHKGLVAQDARVVDQNVDAAEGVERALRDARSTLFGRHVVEVGHGLAARRSNLLRNHLGCGRARAHAVTRAAKVVDDQQGAFARKLQRVAPTEAAAGTRYDRYLSIQQSHVLSPKFCVCRVVDGYCGLRSMIVATPWPKPMQRVARPYRRSRFSSSFSSVPMMRTPEQPSG